jgi:hypothetical protein
MKIGIIFSALFFLGALGVLAVNPETSSNKLDRAIQDVISKREYQWRMPRQAPPEEKQNLFIKFLEGWVNAINKVWNPVKNLLGKIMDWLRRALTAISPSYGSGKGFARGQLNVLIIGLIVLLTGIILFFLWKIRKRKKQEEEIILAQAILPVPDLRDENVIADQLPEEGWLRLAHDLLTQGEFRLAMRALFMSSLASLAETRWITIAKFKSNQDYWFELQRRAHDRKEMQDAFYDNVSAVDRVWYGMHPVTEEMIYHFRENVEAVKRAAA